MREMVVDIGGWMMVVGIGRRQWSRLDDEKG